jgi:hypothetical protein
MIDADDAAAEAEFQRLRASGRYDLLLEIPSFEALEARCGELHGKLLDHPQDRQLMALYDGMGAAWELCRGLVGET